MKRTIRLGLPCVAMMLTIAPAAAQPASLQTRADSDRAFLDRVRGAPASSQAVMQDSVRLRLGHLDSTFDMLVAERSSAALSFASAMNPHWTRLTDYSRTLVRFQQALALDSTPVPAYVVALRQAAFVAFRANDYRTATTLYERMMSAASALHDTANIASAYGGRVRLAARARDYPTAVRNAEEAARIAERLPDARSKIGPFHVLAFANRLAGRYEVAARIYEYTIGLHGVINDPAGTAEEMFNLGFVRLHQNDTVSAARLFRESLTALRLVGSPSQMYLLGAFAALAAVQHQPRRAATLYGAMDTALGAGKVILDPDDQGELETYSALTRKQMSGTAFDSARAEGRSLPLDKAVALALSRY